jgi:predicted transcriptional regulator
LFDTENNSKLGGLMTGKELKAKREDLRIAFGRLARDAKVTEYRLRAIESDTDPDVTPEDIDALNDVLKSIVDRRKQSRRICRPAA